MGFMRRLVALLAVGGALCTSLVTADGVSLDRRGQSMLEAASNVTEFADTIPECTQLCFAAAVEAAGCSGSDLACVCNLKQGFIGYITACDKTECTVNQELEMEKTLRNACGDPIHDQANSIRAVYWTLYGVASVCFGSRLLARSARFGGTFWWDDWFIVASFCVLTGVSIGAEIMVVFGLGKDKWDLDATHIEIVLILFYVAEFAYVVESALTKTSIVVLYLRIFPTKRFRRFCFAMLAFIAAFMIVFVVTLLTYCVPFSYVWTSWDNRHSGKCINMSAQTYVCAALNIVMDVTIFLLPIPKLSKLETSWRTKIGVIFTFMLGLFVTICSIVRLKFLVGWANSTNPTYDYADLALWSLIELNAGVICACLPGMASLLRRIRREHTEKKKSSAMSYGNTSSAARSAGGSRMFASRGGGGGGGSGMRSFAGKEGIMKTTSVEVNYMARDRLDSDGLSDEVELVEQQRPTTRNGEPF